MSNAEFDRFDDLQRKLNEGISRAGEEVDDFISGSGDPELDKYFMPVLEEKKKRGRPKKIREENETEGILKRMSESFGSVDKYVSARSTYLKNRRKA